MKELAQVKKAYLRYILEVLDVMLCPLVRGGMQMSRYTFAFWNALTACFKRLQKPL